MPLVWFMRAGAGGSKFRALRLRFTGVGDVVCACALSAGSSGELGVEKALGKRNPEWGWKPVKLDVCLGSGLGVGVMLSMSKKSSLGVIAKVRRRLVGPPVVRSRIAMLGVVGVARVKSLCNGVRLCVRNGT